MEYVLRCATDVDRAWLDELRRRAYADLFVLTWGGWDEERHLRHFAESWRLGHIRVVVLDDLPVGMIQILEHDDALEVEEIQILPDYQSSGLGTALLHEVIARGRAEAKHIDLKVALKNRARGLYRRLGFEPVGVTATHFLMRRSAPS